MKCHKCGSPCGIMIGHRCNFCENEGTLARLGWWLWPDMMLRLRWRQNLRSGGWL